jgi:hypothetical protein
MEKKFERVQGYKFYFVKTLYKEGAYSLHLYRLRIRYFLINFLVISNADHF